MQHVQGYTGSHWTPPSGDYSLRIALAAARATANKTTMFHVPTLMAISVVIAMQAVLSQFHGVRDAKFRHLKDEVEELLLLCQVDRKSPRRHGK